MIRAYLVAAVVMLALDTVWLLAVASPLYRAELGDRIAEQPDLLAGGLFYVGYVAALLWFAVRPGLAAGSVRVAATHGALLGLAAYGTWALTNRAVLAGWPWALVPLDVAWGAVLSAITSGVTVLVARRWSAPSRAEMLSVRGTGRDADSGAHRPGRR